MSVCSVLVREMTRFASSWRVTRSILECRWDQICHTCVTNPSSVSDPLHVCVSNTRSSLHGGSQSFTAAFQAGRTWWSMQRCSLINAAQTFALFSCKLTSEISVSLTVFRCYRIPKRFLILMQTILNQILSNMPTLSTRGHQKTSEKSARWWKRL